MDKTLSRKAADIDRILSKADSLQATFDGSSGSESYTNLLAAIQAGKTVTILYNNRVHHYQGLEDTSLVFANIFGNAVSIIRISSSSWITEENTFANPSEMGIDTQTGEIYIEI